MHIQLKYQTVPSNILIVKTTSSQLLEKKKHDLVQCQRIDIVFIMFNKVKIKKKMIK